MTNSLIAVPILKNSSVFASVTQEHFLEEIVALVKSINLSVKHCELITLAQPKTATLFGSGKIAELSNIIAKLNIELLIVDHSLTPVQQSNLEKTFKIKVIDRTALILEIFGARARTREGILQVELAHLTYQKSRLIRSWTHLERQRGGAGFMGGPGEKQIEADKRHLQQKIKSIKKQLESIVNTRKLHRKKRKKIPYLMVALVGYTNAGKSTLFNSLTSSKVLAEDMLFATLDPTLRKLSLPSGNNIIISDTVGFIAQLPIMLVAAFRATLEEVCEADLLLHVCDISNIDYQQQKAEVYKTLKYLDIDVNSSNRVIEIWNKIDRLEEGHINEVMANSAYQLEKTFPISAKTGQNIDELLQHLDTTLYGTQKYYKMLVAPDNFSMLESIYSYGSDIRKTHHENGSVEIIAKLSRINVQQLEGQNLSLLEL